jgi:hypothetical protein
MRIQRGWALRGTAALFVGTLAVLAATTQVTPAASTTLRTAPIGHPSLVGLREVGVAYSFWGINRETIDRVDRLVRSRLTEARLLRSDATPLIPPPYLQISVRVVQPHGVEADLAGDQRAAVIVRGECVQECTRSGEPRKLPFDATTWQIDAAEEGTVDDVVTLADFAVSQFIFAHRSSNLPAGKPVGK